ncbi:MAG: ComF family protein [Candidatus Margulisbacteria bacterium]|nr:ComF family protein [Candidatus Margulisiibacteriota bacterium]
MLNALLDLIFPPRCEVCKKDGKEALCNSCFSAIRFMKPHLGVHSVAVYDGVMKEAIQRFKFNKRKNLAGPLGVLMVQYIAELKINMQEIDTLIPVPLHPRRQRERGFNQVHYLAEIVSRYFGKPVVPALSRVKDTKPHFGLGREERFININQAFAVNDSRAVYNKRILLIDDIYTTGATMAECSRTLQIAGAKKIELLTLSRAVEF